MKAIKTTIAQKGTALYIKSLIAGFIVGGIILMILMCVTAFALVVTGKLPHSLIKWIMLGLSCISVFIGGYVSAKVSKEKGIIMGSVTGFIMFVSVLCAGLLDSDGIFTYMTLIKLILFVVSGAIGGIKGVNKQEKIHIK